jgi:hypothetical protein
MWWDEQVWATSATRLPDVRPAHPPAPATAPSVQASPDRPPAAAPVDHWQWWWQYARDSARRWLQGITPPVIDIYGPVLDDDEDGLLEADLTYSRLYGGDGFYRRADLFVLGRPAVMAGVLAASAAVNHRRKVVARREAEVRWRDTQPARVWATTRRLICDTTTFGVVRFDYAAATEFYPDLDHWNLTLGFDESSPPLRLSGPAAPAICLWAAIAIVGDRWVRDPRMARLLA